MHDRNPLFNLFPLLIIIFFDSFAYFLIIPVLLQLFVSSNLILSPEVSIPTRNVLFSIALMISPLSFLIACPIVGHCSDRFGRKKTMFFCLLASVIGFVIPIVGIIKKQAFLILLGRFIAGGSTSSQPVAQAAMADISEGQKKAFYLSLIGFSMTLAMVLGPITGSLFSEKSFAIGFNVTTPYWIGFLLSIFNIFLLLFSFKETTQATTQIGQTYSLKNLLAVLCNHKIFVLLLVFFLLEIAWSQYYQAIFLFLNHQFHYSNLQIGSFTTYIGIWMCLGLTLIYRIALKYMSFEKIAKWSLIVATAGFIGCDNISSVIAQWVFIAPTAVCVGMAYASLLAIISNRAEVSHQGLILGWASTALAGAWMITGFLSGTLTNVAIPLPIYFASVTMIFGLIVFIVKAPVGS